jgi:hypothetical protein
LRPGNPRREQGQACGRRSLRGENAQRRLAASLAGRPHEPIGDDRPREMIAARFWLSKSYRLRKPVGNRIRLIDLFGKSWGEAFAQGPRSVVIAAGITCRRSSWTCGRMSRPYASSALSICLSNPLQTDCSTFSNQNLKIFAIPVDTRAISGVYCAYLWVKVGESGSTFPHLG